MARKRPGKEFEAFVQWVQRCLHARAEVVPNARMRDHQSGGLREIDVAIRLRDGPTDLLIIGEVRDRGRPADVSWIADVADKRDAVRAHCAFVISRSGLTGPARNKAEAERIRVFSYDEAMDEPWGSAWSIDHVAVTMAAVEIHLSFLDAAGQPLSGQPDLGPADTCPDDPLAVTGTLAPALRAALVATRGAIGDALLAGPQSREVTFDLETPAPIAQDDGTVGLIRRAVARFDFQPKSVRYPLVRHVYRDAEHRVHAAVLEGHVWVDGGLFRLHLLAPPTTGDAPFPANTELNVKVSPLDAAAEALLQQFELVGEPVVTGRAPSGVTLATIALGLRRRAA